MGKKRETQVICRHPLIYKGEAVAVLGMFSEKMFSPTQFRHEHSQNKYQKNSQGFLKTKDFLIILTFMRLDFMNKILQKITC